MKPIRTTLLACAAAASLFAIAPAAHAGTVVTFPATSSGTGGDSGRVYTVTVGSTTVKMRVTAWSTAGTAANSAVKKGDVEVYSQGLGDTSTGESGNSPHHTIDNLTNKDFLILQFDQFVELEGATFATYNMGSGRSDGDATIAHGVTGANWMSDPLANSTTYSQLSALFGNSFTASDVASTSSDTMAYRNLNSGNNVGNIWLVGAAFANPVENCGTKWNAQPCLDGFKLSQIKVQTAAPPVPEPSTWAMMMLGFGFIGAALRRRNKPVFAATA